MSIQDILVATPWRGRRPTTPSQRVPGAISMGLIACLALVSFPGAAAAGQWNIVGSRAQGMGGTGVGTTEDSGSYYWNPAAFGFKKRGEWDVQLPITINAAIENNVLEDVSDLAFRSDEIQGVLDAFEGGGDLSTITQPEIDATVSWLADLNALGDNTQSVHSQIGIGLLGHVGNFGFGGLSNTTATIYPDVDLTNLGLDQAALDQFLSVVPEQGNTASQTDLINEIAAISPYWDTAKANALVDAFVAAPGVDADDPETETFIRTLADGVNAGGTFADNESGVVTAGLSLQEFGLSYGLALPSPIFKPFLDKKISIGATAKYIMGVAFVQTARYVDDGVGSGLGDIFSFDDAEISHNFGLDLGVDYRPLPFARFGIVARNVNAPKFSAGAFGKIKVHPQVRLGTSLMPLENLVLAMDVDLTENGQYEITGAVPQSTFRSRMLSLGTEYTIPMGAPSALALRFGAYNNLASSSENGWALTGGLGLKLWGFVLDLSAGGSLDRERVRTGDTSYVNIPDRLNVGLGLKWEKSL